MYSNSIRDWELRPQLRLLIFLLPAVLALAAIALVRKHTGIPLRYFMEDPASITHTPFYTGIFSNIGIVLWCASAAICFFCSAILFKGRGDKNQRTFFLCSGLMISVLLLDDLFMLHERILPDYLAVPQNLVQASYGLMALLYLRRFWRILFSAEHLILFTAFGCLGFSAFCDVIPFRVPGHLLFEEGSKLLGIASFLIYFTKEGIRHFDPVLLPSVATTTVLSEPAPSYGYSSHHREPAPSFAQVSTLLN